MPNDTLCAATDSLADAGQKPALENLRVASGVGAGRRSFWDLGRDVRRFEIGDEWPGKQQGIRAPEFDETALSEAEIAWATS